MPYAPGATSPATPQRTIAPSCPRASVAYTGQVCVAERSESARLHAVAVVRKPWRSFSTILSSTATGHEFIVPVHAPSNPPCTPAANKLDDAAQKGALIRGDDDAGLSPRFLRKGGICAGLINTRCRPRS